jgi:hypothetical protein
MIKGKVEVYKGKHDYYQVKRYLLEFLDDHGLLEKIFGSYGYSDRDKQLSGYEEL